MSDITPIVSAVVVSMFFVSIVPAVAYYTYQFDRLNSFSSYIGSLMDLARINARAAIIRGERDTWERYFTIDIDASYKNFSKFSNSFSTDWVKLVVQKKTSA